MNKPDVTIIIEIIKAIFFTGIMLLALFKFMHLYSKEINENANAQSRLVQIISEAISLNTGVLSRLERSIEVLTNEINHLRHSHEWWQAPENKDK